MKHLQLSAAILGLVALGSVLTATVHSAEPPAISSAVAPVYPAGARAAHITGDVSVDITIDRNGKVTSAAAVNAHPLLKKAVEDAARQWAFVAAPRGQTERMARLDFTFVILSESDASEVTSIFYPWYYKIEVRASVGSH
jgi:TonB family protein